LKTFYSKYLLSLILSLGYLSAFSQSEEKPRVKAEETVKAIDTGHSVSKATWLSTAFPGLGQAYNGSYWKMPIIYAAMGTTIYFAIDNHNIYREFLDAFYVRTDDDPNTVDAYVGAYNERQLIEIQNQFRKWRDLNIILTVVIYALNILDAHVDAHLYYYNVNDNLSLHLEPSIIQSPYYNSMGISLKFNF